MDSFALMWFGLQRGTAQSDTFSQRAELLSLSVCSSCVFKQANQHHSAVLASLSLSLPQSLLSACLEKATGPLSHTLLSLVANSYSQTVPLFFALIAFIFSSLSSASSFFFLQTDFHHPISVSLPCFVLCFILLILSSPNLSSLSFSLPAKPAIGHIVSLRPLENSTPCAAS